MTRIEYVSPCCRSRSVRLQVNVLSAGVVDSISDNGLPRLDTDDSTLDWIEN